MTLRILVLWFILTCVAKSLVACDGCVSHSLKAGFKGADAVFVGEVVRSEVAGAVTLRVTEVFKGEVTGEIVVHTRGRGCAYDRMALEGQNLIFAERDEVEGKLVVWSCSHSNPITNEYVEQALRTVRARARWWRCPLSSWNPRDRARLRPEARR